MRIRSVALTRLAGLSAALALKALARTLRFECRTEVDGFSPEHPDVPPCLYCLWHDAILIPLATRVPVKPDRPVSALVSRHQDGSYLAEFMKGLGIDSVRGSTRRGGDAAVRTLIRTGEESHIYITPDGPRGPRREVKSGILFLAAQTGMPIVPVGSAGSAGWRLRGSWTDLYVPKPFSKVAHYLGAPIYVSTADRRSGFEDCRRSLQDEMSRVERRAESVLRGEAIDCHGWSRKAA